MRINFNNKAFSLLEVLLASVIFVVSVAGIFATLNAVRTPTSGKEYQLQAAVVGKQVLEALMSNVDANSNTYAACQNVNADQSCGDFSLFWGPHEVSTLTLQNPANLGATWTWPAALVPCNSYLSYTVSCGDGSPLAGPPYFCTSLNTNVSRRVDVNIGYPVGGTCT